MEFWQLLSLLQNSIKVNHVLTYIWDFRPSPLILVDFSRPLHYIWDPLPRSDSGHLDATWSDPSKLAAVQHTRDESGGKYIGLWIRLPKSWVQWSGGVPTDIVLILIAGPVLPHFRQDHPEIRNWWHHHMTSWPKPTQTPNNMSKLSINSCAGTPVPYCRDTSSYPSRSGHSLDLTKSEWFVWYPLRQSQQTPLVSVYCSGLLLIYWPLLVISFICPWCPWLFHRLVQFLDLKQSFSQNNFYASFTVFFSSRVSRL